MRDRTAERPAVADLRIADRAGERGERGDRARYLLRLADLPVCHACPDDELAPLDPDPTEFPESGHRNERPGGREVELHDGDQALAPCEKLAPGDGP